MYYTWSSPHGLKSTMELMRCNRCERTIFRMSPLKETLSHISTVTGVPMRKTIKRYRCSTFTSLSPRKISWLQHHAPRHTILYVPIAREKYFTELLSWCETWPAVRFCFTPRLLFFSFLYLLILLFSIHLVHPLYRCTSFFATSTQVLATFPTLALLRHFTHATEERCDIYILAMALTLEFPLSSINRTWYSGVRGSTHNPIKETCQTNFLPFCLTRF